MTRYVLTQINGDSKIVYEFSTEILSDVLRHFGYFLRGCSFVINKYADLQFVWGGEPDKFFEESLDDTDKRIKKQRKTK